MGQPTAFTFSSRTTDPQKVAQELTAAAAGKPVRAAIVYCTVAVDPPRLLKELRRALPGAALVGTTVCQQVATDAGAGLSVGALLLSGDGFRVGVAAGEPTGNAMELGEKLTLDALKAAGMTAKDARFVVLHGTPGLETPLLGGITATLGDGVPVVGGSSADNDISGKWWAFAGDRCVQTGASLLVCDWPWKMGLTYQSGYVASDRKGRVTRASGRRIHEIDGKRAADVYQSWLGAQLPVEQNVLGLTTLKPLGVVRGQAAGLDLHVLVHAERVHADGSISTFAEVETGEHLVMMESSLAALTRRGGSVVKFAMNGAGLRPDDVMAQLVVYCAGCSLALGDGVEAMVAATRKELGAPMVMPFTFGEQGSIRRGRADHGNLMCSALLLTTKR